MDTQKRLYHSFFYEAVGLLHGKDYRNSTALKRRRQIRGTWGITLGRMIKVDCVRPAPSGERLDIKSLQFGPH